MSLNLLLPDPAVLNTWPTEPHVYQRGITDLDGVVTLDLIDAHMRHGMFDPLAVGVVRDGASVHPREYMRGHQLLPGRLHALINDDGCTVDLHAVESRIPFLADAVAAVEAETGYSVYVAAFVSPPGHPRGLPPHWDQWTALVTQMFGQKRWQLWRPAVEYPAGSYLTTSSLWTAEWTAKFDSAPPDYEFTLNPGDTLVVPRGWIHSPQTVGDERSFHLTWAITERSRLSLAQQLLGLALSRPDFRAEVPPGPLGVDELDAVRALAVDFLEGLDAHDCVSLVRSAIPAA